jgi:hypothetical protein
MVRKILPTYTDMVVKNKFQNLVETVSMTDMQTALI